MQTAVDTLNDSREPPGGDYVRSKMDTHMVGGEGGPGLKSNLSSLARHHGLSQV